MFSTLANGESYSKLDLALAYKQMRVSAKSLPLLTINVHLGLFQYTRLPFGISTAQALQQKAMVQVLQGVVYFIDDILVTVLPEWTWSKPKGCFRQNLWIWAVAKAVQVPVFPERIRVLGHVISKDGVQPTQSRIKSVQDMPAPQNKQELQSFFSMITYSTTQSSCHICPISYIHCTTYQGKMQHGSGGLNTREHL